MDPPLAQILANIPGLCDALKTQRETDPLGYWLSYEATPGQFAGWLYWGPVYA